MSFPIFTERNYPKRSEIIIIDMFQISK